METLEERIIRLLPPAEFEYSVDVQPLEKYPEWQAVSVTVYYCVHSQPMKFNRRQAMDCKDLSDGQLKSWLEHHLASIRNQIKITEHAAYGGPKAKE